MKKIIKFLAFMMLGVSIGYSQTISPIVKKPSHANGYLILNNVYYSTVTSWKLSIKERVWNQSTNSYSFVDQMTKTINAHHYKIPAEYNTSDYIVDITGYNSSGSEVIHDVQQMNGDPTITICKWVCEGSNYVYGLQLNQIPMVGERIQMSYPDAPSDEMYYYQWIQADQWGTFTASHDAEDYAFSDWGLASLNGGDKIVHKNLPSGQYRYDEFGSPLSGSVIGIAKSFGHTYTPYWMGLMSNVIFAGEEDCSQPISWAIGLVNLNTSNPITVSNCNGRSFNSAFDGDIFVEVVDPESNDPCEPGVFEVITYGSNDSPTETYGFLELVTNCSFLSQNPNGEDGTNGVGISWPTELQQLTIKSMENSGTATEINLNRGNTFDSQGNFIGSSYTMPAGFYNIIYHYTDGSMASYYYENPTLSTSTIQDKDFLGYTTYPVPITGDSYNIDFNSSKNIGFTYELRDSKGNLLYSDVINLDKDSPYTYNVNVSGGIPSGMLFNKFIFEDGSVINYTTVK